LPKHFMTLLNQNKNSVVYYYKLRQFYFDLPRPKAFILTN